MMIDRHLYRWRLAVFALLTAAGALGAADDEDFNWTDAAQFVDSLPFPQKFIDSLTAVYNVTAPSPPLRSIPPQGFAKGEMLVYDIGWSFIKGGYVILTATPDPSKHTIRLGAKALSRGFVSTFYRMRDYAISTVDADGLYPLFFEEHLREGKRYKSNRWFLYDHAGKKLHLRDRTPAIPEFTNDYVSLLYVARTRKFAPGDTFAVPFFVDGKLYRLVFSCIKRATMDFNGKKVSCCVVLPQPADDKGEFNRKKRLEIWLSDDENRLPMRIKAKIAIGSIVADLIYAGRPKAEKSAAVNTEAAEKTDTLEPRPAKKARTAPVEKDSSGNTGADTALVTPDTLPLETTGPTAMTGADTAKAPAPPVSRKFYETIEINGPEKSPTSDTSGNGCCGEPEPRPCSRDNSY